MCDLEEGAGQEVSCYNPNNKTKGTCSQHSFLSHILQFLIAQTA